MGSLLPSADGPRLGKVTPDEQGSLIGIACWFLSVVTVLAIAMRLAIRFNTAHIPGKDDAIACAAMLASIGSAVAISIGIREGLGKSAKLVKPGDITHFQKAVYAATLLYILGIGLAKLSILVLIGRLTLTKTHLKGLQALSGMVVVWTLVAIFAAAFECHLPRPWDYFRGQCFDPRPFWYVMGSIDIITDILTIVLPIMLVWGLQMSQGKKIAIGIAFAFRTFVIAAGICRLFFLGELVRAKDKNLGGVPYHICTQCHVALSIIVACVPTLKPFLGRTESGMMNVAFNPHMTGGSVYAGQGSYGMKNLSKDASSASRSGSHQKVWRPDGVDYKAVVTGHPRWSNKNGKAEPKGDEGSLESTAGSEQMIIRQTTDWEIQYGHDGNVTDPRPDSSPGKSIC